MKSLQPLKVLLFLAPVVLLNGCASSSSGMNDKCSYPNWHRIGYRDGINGVNKRDLNHYYSDCGPDFIINKPEYDKGWKSGVAMYCSPRNALKLGMEGKLYNNVCPDNQISAFDKSWHEGIRSYCTAANAYTRGLEGGDFPGFCPPYANLAFKKAYDRGHRVYLKLKALKDKYAALDTSIQTLEVDIKKREEALEQLQRAFTQEAFSPKKQYQIQRIKLHIKQLATKMSHLVQERDAALQKYNTFVKQYIS